MSAPRKLRNAAVTLSLCVVRSALDGGELLAFQKVLPYSFQTEDFEESWELWGWKVVSSQEPLQSFRFLEDDAKLRWSSLRCQNVFLVMVGWLPGNGRGQVQMQAGGNGTKSLGCMHHPFQ